MSRAIDSDYSAEEEEEDTDEEAVQYRQGCTIVFFTVLAFVAGTALLLVSIGAVKSHSLWVIDRLVLFEFRDSAIPVVTTRRIFMLLIGISAIVMVVCLLGCISVQTRNKRLAASFTVPTTVLALVVLLAGIQAFQRKTSVEPIMYEQVDDLCNVTTYVRLGRNIPCSWEADFESEPMSECGEFCRGRVESLQSLDGCDILPDLCGVFSYAQVGCDGQTQSEQMFIIQASSTECATHCDDDIACTGYMYSEGRQKCILTAGVATQHELPDWQEVNPSDVTDLSSWECYEREEPRALELFRNYGTSLAWTTTVLGIILMLAGCSSMALTYDASIKRRGKPTARNLLMLMCCPCCASDRHNKWKEQMIAGDEESGYE